MHGKHPAPPFASVWHARAETIHFSASCTALLFLDHGQLKVANYFLVVTTNQNSFGGTAYEQKRHCRNSRRRGHRACRMDVHASVERADRHHVCTCHAAGIEHGYTARLACPGHTRAGNTGASNARTCELSHPQERETAKAAGSEESRRPYFIRRSISAVRRSPGPAGCHEHPHPSSTFSRLAYCCPTPRSSTPNQDRTCRPFPQRIG